MILEQLDKKLHQHPLEIKIQLENITFYPLEPQTLLQGLQTIFQTNYK
jgi:hypothetical protein